MATTSDAVALPAAPSRLFTGNFLRLCIAALLFMGSMFVVVPVLPLYVKSVGGTEIDVGLVMGSFTLTSLVLRLMVGRWLDQGWRRRRLLWTGVGIFFAAALIYPVARAIAPLLGLRLFQGTGMALYNTTSTSLVAESVPLTRLGEAMGFYGMATTLGMAVAPALGAAILGWSGGFLPVFVASGVLVVLAGVVTFGIQEPPRKEAKHVRWRDLFNRRAWLPFVLALSASSAFTVILTFLPLLVEARGHGNAGLFFTVYSLITLVVRVVAGRASDRFGRGVAIVPGLLATGAALAVLALFASPAGFWAAAVVFGLGFGISNPALSALSVEVVPADQRGSAIATYVAGFELGIGAGSIAFGPILQASGFTTAFLIAAATPILGAILYVVTIGARRPSSHPQEVLPC
ncbi:MAG TPA: MFS transporter [Dehalococcoidia bacterium]|nr:MFS transporter [Dehalococcoidia bacterium]